MTSTSFLRAGITLALLPAIADAGVVTGTLRDSSGQPVRNAIFQVESRSGDVDPIVSGGFSDANGNFTTTITPDGEYRIDILPLAPPQSLVVTKRLESVVVGTSLNNLGVIELEVGALLTGRVVGATGVPLFEVQLDFIAGSDQQPRDFRSPDTNINGFFAVAVPYGACEVRFKPGPVPYYGGPNAAPTSRTWVITGPLEVGDVVMPRGYSVGGQVVSASDGTPVEDAQVRVVNVLTGATAFTPDNRTTATGFFSVVLPEGRYDFHATPRSNDGLGTTVVRDRAVPPAFSLGTIELYESYELRGRVRDEDNDPVGGVTVSLVESATNLPVYVSNNVTTADGHYRMDVPSGTFDIRFTPPNALALGMVEVPGVVIQSDESVDADLPIVPHFNLAGAGSPGSGGIEPTIRSEGGAPRLGNLGYTLVCANGLGGAWSHLAVTLGTAPVGSAAGRRLAGPVQLQFRQLAGAPGVPGAGSLAVAMPIQHLQALSGVPLRARFTVFDPAAPGGMARTQELQAVIQP